MLFFLCESKGRLNRGTLVQENLFDLEMVTSSRKAPFPLSTSRREIGSGNIVTKVNGVDVLMELLPLAKGLEIMMEICRETHGSARQTFPQKHPSSFIGKCLNHGTIENYTMKFPPWEKW